MGARAPGEIDRRFAIFCLFVVRFLSVAQELASLLLGDMTAAAIRSACDSHCFLAVDVHDAKRAKV